MSWRTWVVIASTSTLVLAGCEAVLGLGSETNLPAGDAGSKSDVTTTGDDGGVDGSGGDDGGGDASCGQWYLNLSPDALTSLQSAVSVCVSATSCDPYYWFSSISDCVQNYYMNSISSPEFKCLTAQPVASCAAFQQCAGLALPQPSQCPGDGGPVAYCSDGLAINCPQPTAIYGSVQQCNITSGDAGCGTYLADNGDASTPVADCKLSGSCTETDGLLHCDTFNNAQYYCVNGVKYGSYCALTGGTCVEDNDGGVTGCILPNGTSCANPGTSTCTSGNVADLCNSPGNGPFGSLGGTGLYALDCNVASLQCTSDHMGGADCLSPGCTLDDYANCTESCGTGSTGTICIGGAPYPIDCANYGFGSCYQDINSNFNTVVYCIP
jgi:hypothetical protein